MDTEAGTDRRRRGVYAALAALVVVAIALVAVGVVSALEGARGLHASPSSIHFGEWEVGRGSDGQRVALTNHGGQPTIRSIRIDGEHADDFAVDERSTCVDGPFPTNASCTIVVRFTPTAPGDRTAILGVEGISGGPVVVLGGTGRTP